MAETSEAPLSLERLHPRLSGFDSFFSGDLMAKLQSSEAERKRHLRPVLMKFAGVVVVGIAVGVGGFLVGDVQPWGVMGLMLAFIIISGGFSWVSKPMREARNAGTSALITGLCGFLKLSYNRSIGDFGFSGFGSAGVIPSHDRKRLEDRIGGEHEGVAFDLIEAKLEQRRTTTDSKGRTRTYYVTVFNGLLISAASPRAFHGRTLVTADSGKLGNLLGGLFRKDERITLESPDFERDFEVYATDQVEARVLLTPTMMERLVDLKRKLGSPPRLAFAGNRVLLAIPRKGNQFEAGGTFSSITDPAHIREAVSELCEVFRILDTLDLKQGARG